MPDFLDQVLVLQLEQHHNDRGSGGEPHRLIGYTRSQNLLGAETGLPIPFLSIRTIVLFTHVGR